MPKTKKNIRTAMHEENEAVTDYSKMAKTAQKEGDKSAASLFRHIGKDEKHHKSELAKLKRKTK